MMERRPGEPGRASRGGAPGREYGITLPARLRRLAVLAALVLLAANGVASAQSHAAVSVEPCGEVVTVATHAGSTTRYSLARSAKVRPGAPTLVLLVGGGGRLDLDAHGCPQSLKRNVLVRMIPLLSDAGVASALVDAPSDMPGDEGLGGFRVAEAHAADLGRVIADLRVRGGGAVWILGHSRGTISAAGAAARLKGAAAPDGVVLLSAMLAGDSRARKAWVAQTVSSVDLAAIDMPLLLVGHAADNCPRSPPERMAEIAAKLRAARRQLVTVTGGPVPPGRLPALAACEVGEPHDFADQEAELAAGLLRFVAGGSY